MLSRLGRLLSAQSRVALASASRRLARPLSLWPRRAGQTISPAKLHDRVYEPYAHRALELRPPEDDERREGSPVGEIRRRDRLGGLIHEYYRAAA